MVWLVDCCSFIHCAWGCLSLPLLSLLLVVVLLFCVRCCVLLLVYQLLRTPNKIEYKQTRTKTTNNQHKIQNHTKQTNVVSFFFLCAVSSLVLASGGFSFAGCHYCRWFIFLLCCLLMLVVVVVVHGIGCL